MYVTHGTLPRRAPFGGHISTRIRMSRADKGCSTLLSEDGSIAWDPRSTLVRSISGERIDWTWGILLGPDRAMGPKLGSDQALLEVVCTVQAGNRGQPFGVLRADLR